MHFEPFLSFKVHTQCVLTRSCQCRYVYVEPVALVPDDIIDAAEWLIRQLALFLGRHTSRCPFVATLAAHAGINLAEIPQTGTIPLFVFKSNNTVFFPMPCRPQLGRDSRNKAAFRLFSCHTGK